MKWTIFTSAAAAMAILSSRVAAYIPARPVNDTSAMNLSDASMLELMWYPRSGASVSAALWCMVWKLISGQVFPNNCGRSDWRRRQGMMTGASFAIPLLIVGFGVIRARWCTSTSRPRGRTRPLRRPGSRSSIVISMRRMRVSTGVCSCFALGEVITLIRITPYRHLHLG